MNHVVALSGGKDSTALAVRLKEVEPRHYIYVCTPTGRELPPMIEHWKRLEGILEAPLVYVYAPVGFIEQIRLYNTLPSHAMRWCTREQKIKPYQNWLQDKLPATSYVGLRADEERLGAVYDELSGITQDYPFKRWGWGLKEVRDYLKCKGIVIPKRSDCDFCYDQQIGEWYEFWRDYRPRWMECEGYEAETGHTFRSDARDSWPAAMKELRAKFESGMIPRTVKRQVEMFDESESSGRCRVCSL